jgi:exosortase A
MQMTAQGAFRLGSPERAFAWVVGVLMVVAGAFWSTSASMVAVWNGSGTYSHGFFIVPAFLWLVWGRRRTLAALPMRPSWWALAALVVIGAGWMVSHWMAMALPSQLAMVAMVPAAIAAVFGVAWVRALLFPLAFLFFAVPFGESLVPVLMDWTADFTVAALKVSGVPVYRDGLHFDIPSGKWSVVDSCSGIRYLFACVAVSSLYAWTVYRGRTRRLLFVGFAIVIAIVANWIRAYAIVMLGHLSNNKIATGADHLVYGGLFFAVIMAMVFALGTWWREEADIASASGARGSAQPPVIASEMPLARAVVATLATLLVWPLLSTGSSSIPSERTALGTASVVAPHAGWLPIDTMPASWRPVLRNPVASASRSFARGEQVVGLHIGLFGRSTSESKLTTVMNRFVEADGLNPSWKLSKLGRTDARWGDRPIAVRTGTLVGTEGRLLAWQWYWVDGEVTSDPIRASWLQLQARLRGRSEASAWISIYTGDADVPGAAERLLQAFMADMSPAIDALLQGSTVPRVASGVAK